MIIIAYKPGQLCNRLFYFGHFIAKAVEHDVALINLGFKEYSSLFPATRSNSFEGHKISVRPPFGLLRYRVVNFVARLIGRLLPASPLHEIIKCDLDEPLDIGSPSFIDKAKRKLCIVIYGFEMRDRAMFAKHSKLLRRIFATDADICSAVNDRIGTLRRNSGVTVVGVHIRRGDYATFHGGKYFYSNRIYRNKMQEVMATLGHDKEKRIVFLICSNEPIDLAEFDGLDVTFSASSQLIDLYSLAKCDLIMGPPSTFSRWASFYGNVPLGEISDPTTPITTEMFSVVTS
jgi:hypothetical protein